MKKVFVSILNFNGKRNTLECLRSIDNLKQSNFELRIIVIDNASAEKFHLEENFKSGISVKLIENKKNLGFAGGHNVGFQYTLKNGADYVLVLNNDTFVDSHLLDNLFKIIESEEKIGIAVPKIYFAKGFEFHKARYAKEELGKVIWYAGGQMDWANVIGYNRGVDEVDVGQYDKMEQTEIATGCCMLIKRSVLDKIGLFDEKYFLYYEDADLSIRAKEKGYKIIYVPSSIVWHKNAGSAGGSGSSLQDYYISRNRLLFGFKYAPFRAKASLIKESFKLLFNGRKWQKRGVLDYYLGRFGRGSFTI